MVLSVNASPRLPGPDQAARLLWGGGIRDHYYGPRAQDPVAGEFLDSLEGYVMEDLDFKPEHLRYASTPPTWSRESPHPALLKGSIQLEYLKWVAQDLRSIGKLIFANGVPCRFACLMPWVDIAGMEVDWIPDGRFRPSPDSDLAYWRALSHQKPYLLLFNSDFRKLTPELLERCFKHALFWGIFPSLFSPNAQDGSYWRHPSWFERDRPIFRKYVPLLRRLARAGWTPVSGATLSEGRGVYFEQFGPDAGGVTYFTLENPGIRGERARLVLPPATASPPRVRELLSRTDLPIDEGAVEIFIPPGEVLLLESSPVQQAK
jgi:hypothetical protein